MESNETGSSASHPVAYEPDRQAKLYAIAHELNSLMGQSREKVAYGLFAALVRATGAKSGRLFLEDKTGKPEYSLILVDAQLSEYDEHSSPPLPNQALDRWIYHQPRGIVIADTAKDPRWPAWSTSSEASWAGSALAVPILIAAQPIGAITLLAEHAHHFTEMDLTLITHLVNQAAIILENAHLNRQVDQQQQTIDALHQMTHTIRTSLNLRHTLRTVLHQLDQVISHQHAMILLQEGQQLRLAAATGIADSARLYRRRFTPNDVPAIFHALTEGRTIIAGDEEQFADLGTLDFPQPLHACAIAPLVAQGEMLGGMILVNPKPGIYDDQNILTIDAFADQAAIAVTNHRLAQETERRVQELAFLHKSGQAITSTLNPDRVLQLLLEQVRELLKIDAVSIALRDEQTGNLVFEAASGEGATDVVGVQLKPGQGIAGWVAETGKPLISQDAYADTRFFAGIDKMTGMKTQTIICVPIVLKGHVVGVIEALNPGQVTFDEQDIELLNALAGLAATAIDNARLFAQVQSAESRYERLFEDNADPIIITDLKGTIVEANRKACALLGNSKEALKGTNLTLLHSADGSADFLDPLARVQTDKEAIFQTEMHSDQHRMMIEIKGREILVKETPLIQWIGRDITAEIELEKTREDMVHMIIHDLRNPLANILNSIDVLHDAISEKDDSIPLDELINISRRSGRRMHQLISSILDVNRLGMGQAILETHRTDLVPLLLDAIEFIKPQTDIREITISSSFAMNLPQVEIDPDMISRVVTNLLDNASKFTQVGGAISVTANVMGSRAEVAVADNGRGIPSTQLQSIFEKFTRVHHDEQREGTGLGLAFCHLAVKAHGGRIWAESTLGQGTTMRFTIPVYNPTHPEPKAQSTKL